MGGARNDAELARLLAPAVIKGLQIMGEEHLEPDIRDKIEGATHRSQWYHGGGAGSLSESWSTKTKTYGRIMMGSMETYYDSAKLAHDPWGRHMTPDTYIDANGEERETPEYLIERVEDMATLIDRGLGGTWFGEDNPTRTPIDFWEGGVIPSFEANQRKWIKDGLTKAGLKVL